MRVGVVGIGNVMFGDEGVGVHLAMAMSESYEFYTDDKFDANPLTGDSVEFIDGGTLAIALTPILASFDKLVVIDCISADGGEAGDVYFFDYAAMPKSIRWDGSAHEIEMLQTLSLLELAGDLPPTHILGIVPTRVAPMSFMLSDEVKNGVNLAKRALLKHLQTLGFNYKLRGEVSVQDMADRYAKRGLA
ncbi:HyaD/HybD family hydrogenase maturation endopeptidase [Campylobacter sp. 19-13652]|uniref:HyaD/HybD family hydrogenase maturation endopeptidase n=1 Tax=Campylobacter sp. 19-13652 TaxID=2840180 RepID=UPI001C781032|nr:HyaD/HybD family hydrogenase maturation endopeptidase [Campylobacter sp. 19-13652]BCX79615.1 hydrogenase maturation protease [Campylobacter sp. 19-13652]